MCVKVKVKRGDLFLPRAVIIYFINHSFKSNQGVYFPFFHSFEERRDYYSKNLSINIKHLIICTVI